MAHYNLPFFFTFFDKLCHDFFFLHTILCLFYDCLSHTVLWLFGLFFNILYYDFKKNVFPQTIQWLNFTYYTMTLYDFFDILYYDSRLLLTYYSMTLMTFLTYYTIVFLTFFTNYTMTYFTYYTMTFLTISKYYTMTFFHILYYDLVQPLQGDAAPRCDGNFFTSMTGSLYIIRT